MKGAWGFTEVFLLDEVMVSTEEGALCPLCSVAQCSAHQACLSKVDFKSVFGFTWMC
jgi:hypothetical protein